jgi:hypothetical protein
MLDRSRRAGIRSKLNLFRGGSANRFIWRVQRGLYPLSCGLDVASSAPVG